MLNTLNLTHPMNVVRAAEVQRWVQAGAYERIIRGEYVRRGTEEHERPLRDDMREAAKHYGDEFNEFADEFKNAAKRAAATRQGRLQRGARRSAARENPCRRRRWP